jgi:hypothetical protein
MLCYSFPMTRVPACSAKISLWLEPLLHLVDQNTSCVFPHTSEQDSQPTTSPISKQAVLYQIRGGTCCPGVSTPKTRSLADSSMTTHNTWRNPTVSPIPNLAQSTTSNRHDGHLTSRWMEDQHSHNTQHNPNSTSQRWKDFYDTHDCMAKHN